MGGDDCACSIGMATRDLSSDVGEFIELLSDLRIKVDDARKLVQEAERKVRSDELDTNKGISLLEVKVHLFLAYLIDLTQCMRLKCNGQSIRSSDVVRRMIEARVYLEKLRPLDQKLRYQIDKLIRLATTGSSGLHQDPLQYKPNPENLVSKLHSKDDGEDDEEEEGGDVRSAVYVPPKMMAVPYEETGKRTREQKRDDVAKKRALSSSLLKEIRSEFQDGPEEISFHPAVIQTRNREKDKERERYEEDNFIRLNEKPTKKKRRISDGADLGYLADFDDLTALTGERTPKRRKSAPSTRKKWKGRKGKKSR